jgi:hypothetical protein
LGIASDTKSRIKEGKMDAKSPDLTDDAFSYDILTSMREWRLQHPKATLREIEQALDERWYRLRARMLQDLALQTHAASWQATASAERPTCPDCGSPLIRRGRQPRQLTTHGGQAITLNRTYGYCPSCNKGHFPPR